MDNFAVAKKGMIGAVCHWRDDRLVSGEFAVLIPSLFTYISCL